MRNATPVLPFKTRRPTRRHYFFKRKFPTVFIFTRTTRSKINPAYQCTKFQLPTSISY